MNILWIQTDEQRTDSLGAYGGRNHTPVLDELARRGTVFENHFTASPVCVPARVCELTGRMPHETGVYDNSVTYAWGRWPEQLTTFPEAFLRAGWATANFGKYHTPMHNTWAENFHFEHMPCADFFSFGPGYDERGHECIHYTEKLPIFLAGRYPGPVTPAHFITDRAIEWLRDYRYQGLCRPFLLRVSYLAPHAPVLAPEPFYSRALRETDGAWDEPTEDTLRDRPAFEHRGRNYAPYRSFTPEQLRRMRATYRALVSHVDDEIGRLLDALEQSGELAETIVVFTSDHGDLMGEYGQFQKGEFYDLTCRVPCILAGPGVPAGRRDRLTSCVDLGRTLAGLAGVPLSDAIGGLAMFGDETRDCVTGEIQLGGVRRGWIRTAAYSLDFTEDAAEPDGKLIDLARDPRFHHNVFGDPAYGQVRESLLARFAERTRGRASEVIGKVRMADLS